MTDMGVPSKLTLPELLQGKWFSGLFLTYGADLTFLEGRLLQQLSQVPLRVVMADHRRLADQLREIGSAGQRSRRANKTYAITPIRHPRPAHAKIIMLLGSREGLLIVGSGNLGYSGYASAGEMWNVFRYEDTSPHHREEFQTVRTLVDGLVDRDLIDAPVAALISETWASAPWLPADKPSTSRVRHNLDQALIEQVAEVLPAPVDAIAVHAPFHDPDCAAVEELARRFSPRALSILVSADTSVDTTALARVTDSVPNASVQMVHMDDQRNAFLHAKWVHLRTAKGDVLLTGSANLSRSALLRIATDGNIEAGVIRTGDPGEFDHLYRVLSITDVTDVAGLPLRFESAREAAPVTHRPVVRWSRLDGHRLTVVLDRDIVDAASLRIASGPALLNWVNVHIEGSTIVLDLDPASRTIVEEGGVLRLQWGAELDDVDFTWPYQLQSIRARARAEESRHLHRLGDLPERDAELLDLLHELETRLIFDQVTTWNVARPAAPAVEDDSGPIVRLEELDWDRVRRDPRFTAYGPHRPHGAPPTDIQVILAGITGRLGELGREMASGSETEDDEDDRLGDRDDQADSESGEEQDDDAEDDELRRSLSVSTRTRMAFNRFINRYRAALTDPHFLDQLGPAVVAQNAVIFTALIRGLLDRNAVDPNSATRAQVATWRLLWGEEHRPGLLEQLDAESKPHIEALLAEADVRVGVIQDIDAVVSSALDGPTLRELRDQIRHLVVQGDFDMLDALLCTPTPTEQAQRSLVTNMSRIAWHAQEDEAIGLVVAPLGLRPEQARWVREVLHRGPAVTLVVDARVQNLNPQAAIQALRRLSIAQQLTGESTSYLRLRFHGNGGDVAFWDEPKHDGLVLIDGEHTEFQALEPLTEPWMINLEELVMLWETDASRLATA